MQPWKLGAAATAGLHIMVLAALATYEPARSAFTAATPIMVEWIAAPQPQARSEPPKPKPILRRLPTPVELPPVIAAAPEVASASPMVVPAPPPTPEPEQRVVAPAPAPVTVTPPLFNADYLENPSPAYPALSRRRHEEGRVVLRVLVNARGGADEVQVNSSSGHLRLDDSACVTVKRWRFVPAKRGTEAVPAWVLVPVAFKLEG